ncbi:TIGR01777 family oxidoreductase [Lentibacillus amyloliquefaciens]|uniref:Epimerase n=1 Tax=Lentibacillus amyloliquefaciens TaxID=1472767 RepID=A0A0U3W6Y0_9BACI|nr:TIGR01777 family oxidoreductase [Lentibacillus amyloliquefaciens]ALX48960.1 epimerase [Lentibacillus amyloliquefaciens]
MNIMITGGTGFVGTHLTKELTEKGHHVYVLTRSPEKRTDTNHIAYIGYDHPVKDLPRIHAVINLAGDSLFGYWTRKKKKVIRTSRINTTQKVIRMMEQMETKPDVFISGSAVGFYGTSEELIFTEQTINPGDDFLADVVVDWEQTAKQAEQLGIRTVYTRFGVILGQVGALPLMKLPVKMFAGGRIGNGEQWVSWVHIKDVVGLIHFCMFNEQINGPVNVTAPNPKRNKDFTRVLADILNRPFWLPAPAFMVWTAIGEMSLLIEKGQYVLPKKAKDFHYPFSYPDLKEALDETER